MGRLVITHSTYLEGLIPLLKRLVADAPSLMIACGLAMRRFDP